MDKQTIKNINSISSETLNGKYYGRTDFARSILNYPAMMVPSVQEPILEYLRVGLGENVSLIDPFMGASNSLVTGLKQGMNVFGQDINPLSILLSQVKTSFYLEEELLSAKQRLISSMNADYSTCIEVSFTNIDKWFTKDMQIELSKLYRAIRKNSSLKIRKFFWVALAETIRLSSNDRTSTFKMHIRPIEEINYRKTSSIKVFLNVINKNIRHMCEYISILLGAGQVKNNKYIKSVDIVWGDTYAGINTNKTFNLLVTSPPYGDNQTTVTYGQFSYLPLQWIPVEDVDEKIELEYLKTAQEIDSQSLGGRKKGEIKDAEAAIFEKSKTLKKFITQFKGVERKKVEKVSRFVYDLNVSIDNILLKMRDKSLLVWTIGNRNVNKKIVRNDLILNELFQGKGIELLVDLERQISSKRMPGRNSFSDLMNEEKILIFKKA